MADIHTQVTKLSRMKHDWILRADNRIAYNLYLLEYEICLSLQRFWLAEFINSTPELKYSPQIGNQIFPSISLSHSYTGTCLLPLIQIFGSPHDQLTISLVSFLWSVTIPFVNTKQCFLFPFVYTLHDFKKRIISPN